MFTFIYDCRPYPKTSFVCCSFSLKSRSRITVTHCTATRLAGDCIMHISRIPLIVHRVCTVSFASSVTIFALFRPITINTAALPIYHCVIGQERERMGKMSRMNWRYASVELNCMAPTGQVGLDTIQVDRIVYRADDFPLSSVSAAAQQ